MQRLLEFQISLELFNIDFIQNRASEFEIFSSTKHAACERPQLAVDLHQRWCIGVDEGLKHPLLLPA